MLGRLKSFFNPTGESRLLRRIFWVGFLVRVLVITIAHTYRMRVLNDHFEFGWEMGRIARSLATGHGFANPFNGTSGPTAWTPPLYPLLLAGVFKLFGVYTLKSGWVILTINSIFSAATATAIYRIAWRCFGRGAQGLKIALWSAWLWALYPAAMQYAVKWVWDMSLTAFLFAWVLVVALRLRGIGDEPRTSNPEPRTSLWLLFGLLWGLIALSNSSLLLFLPACGLWTIWPNPGAPSRLRLGGTLRKLIGPTLAALCFAAVIGPWVIRNWEVFHAFVPMRSNFGAELYEATIFSNDGYPFVVATLPMAETAPEVRRYERLGEIEFSRQQGERAKQAIRAHPGLFFQNALHRLYFFWFSVPHPLDTGIVAEAIRRINFAFFSISGFLGLALALRRQVPGAWLFFWAFAIYPILYYFITVQARFRHPLEPIICVLSVYLFQSANRTRAFTRPFTASRGAPDGRKRDSVPANGRITRNPIRVTKWPKTNPQPADKFNTTAAAKRESSGRPSAMEPRLCARRRTWQVNFRRLKTPALRALPMISSLSSATIPTRSSWRKAGPWACPPPWRACTAGARTAPSANTRVAPSASSIASPP